MFKNQLDAFITFLLIGLIALSIVKAVHLTKVRPNDVDED